jgi:hypothetical protein
MRQVSSTGLSQLSSHKSPLNSRKGQKGVGASVVVGELQKGKREITKEVV